MNGRLTAHPLLSRPSSYPAVSSRALRTEWRARLAAALGYDDEVVDLLRMAVARGAARPAWIHAYPEWRFLTDRSDLDAWLTP